ncbi:MAG: ABC transporter ATP-binding protein [Caldilineales bacterium]|nr:ABC transporter ATP-binding protein [Caldilineales bacterium]
MTALVRTTEFSLPSKFRVNHSSPARWMVSHARRHWLLWIIMLIGAFANAAFAAAIPIYTGQAFNGILADPPQLSVLTRTALLILGTQALRGVLQLGRNFGAELIGQRMERDIRDELYASLLGKSMTFHSLQPVGDTMARATNDVREINLTFNPGINLVIGSANFLFMPLLFAPRYHPALILTPLAYILLYVLALWQYLHELQPITREVRESFGKMNTRLAEALDGIETVKGASQEKAEVTRFTAAARHFRDAFVRQGDVEARFLPLLLLGIASAAGLLHALYLYRQGLLSVGDVIAYFGLLQLLGFPTFVSLFAYSQVSSGLSAARRILELINRQTDLDQNLRGHTAAMQGQLSFQGVTFAYNREAEPALREITLTVQPGQTVAIVGQTGAGKTSLVKLVNRTYDVDAGGVWVDGVDVRDWNLASLRSQISIIEQDIFLFSRSIAANIAFGKPDATREEIEAAARAAQAHEFITSFKDGYDSVIGERGVTLSGGQRQRLALARAFLTNPAILILDDSTSAIDSATEDKIQRAIYAAAKGRTTLIITHRLSQIRWADLVIVLRGGRIAAIGTHDDLLRTSPAYRRIFAE